MNTTAKTTLQIPMPLYLKRNTEKVAEQLGFSSIQELIRVLITQISQNKINLHLVNADEFVTLSSSAKSRYQHLKKDQKNGKFHQASSVNQLLDQLEAVNDN